MPKIICDECGKSKMARMENTKFCSRVCSAKYHNRRYREKRKLEAKK